MRARLVLIGTGGNQRYIFSSTKRQEIVGASELITRVERQWADEAFEEVFRGFSRDGWRIEDNDAELLSAGAGGLTAVVRDGGRARALVTALTRRALAQAPGLDVCGVVTEEFAWDGKGELAEVIRKAHALEPAVRAGRPGPQSRFARLPIVDECSASGLPAAELRTPAGDERAQPRSAASVAKLDAYPDALVRLAGAMGADPETDEQAPQAMRKIVDYLGNEADWVAVVHADGNGLGEIFRNFDQIARGERAHDYADALRSFSGDVDECARRALRDAIGHLASRRATRMFDGLPAVLPLVFGGDDLTVVCDGSAALSFTRVYLERFAEHAAERVGGMLTDAGRPLLGAAAGVAIVKRHYPFHFAYGLAEELTSQEAKQVKANLGAAGCAMAFHVLYESSAPDLGRLRSHTESDGARMVAQPYVVGAASEHPWARGRHWDDLKRRVDALKRREVPDGERLLGERLLPSGAVHELREGLFLGTGVARARHTLLERRFTSDRDRRHALGDLGGFWPDVDGRTTTGLLDAMNAAEFFAGEDLG